MLKKLLLLCFVFTLCSGLCLAKDKKGSKKVVLYSTLLDDYDEVVDLSEIDPDNKHWDKIFNEDSDEIVAQTSILTEIETKEGDELSSLGIKDSFMCYTGGKGLSPSKIVSAVLSQLPIDPGGSGVKDESYDYKTKVVSGVYFVGSGGNDFDFEVVPCGTLTKVKKPKK